MRESDYSPLKAALEKLTIYDVWQMLGLQGRPTPSCKSPFREERNASFSIYAQGRRWKDHATGHGGDAADFVAMALGISKGDACRKLIELAGVIPQAPHFPREQKRDGDRPGHLVELPALMAYSKELAQGVANSRRLPVAAVEFASLWMKTIVFARVCDEKCWVLTDASRRCAEARRIDAKPPPPIGTLTERKSHTLAGSNKSWPVGIIPGGFEEPWLKQHVHNLLLVEGGPDYLAACQLTGDQNENVLPVAMLGASQTISQDALPYFADRKTTIVAHSDDTGRAAGLRWAKQIQRAGGTARLLKLTIGGDLCDAVSQGATNEELCIL